MSWDHRAFDGAYAAGFLKKVKQILETKDWSAELWGQGPAPEAARDALAGPMAGERAVPRGAGRPAGAVRPRPRAAPPAARAPPMCSPTGQHADLATNLRCDPAEVGADLVAVSRGGDITYHGPGQLVGYPILSIPNAKGSLRHVVTVEALVIDALAELGLPAPAAFVGTPASGSTPPARTRARSARSACARRGRTMHGFALNVTTDMAYLREHIVACGIGDRPVTSLSEEGIDVPMSRVVDVVAARRRAVGTRVDGTPGRGLVSPPRRPGSVLPRAPGRARGRLPPEPVRLTSRTGRRHDGTVDRDPQARLVAPEGPSRPGGDAAQAQRARARARHRVRGRRLPEPVGVLVRRHGDADAAR